MTAADRLEPGMLFANDFRIVRPLAEGGFGSVYVAEQLSTRKPRALKVLRIQVTDDPSFIERFVREASVGSQIQSDHVVEVIAAGVDAATQLPWLAMEMLDGLDLASLVARRGPIAPHDTIEICRQLCHALAAAHDAGVVHRDLKPENVFIARARRADVPFTVKLLDFGIAKVLQDASEAAPSVAPRDASTARSSTLHVIGSPLWMAPEQIKLSQVSPSTDVWAFGLLVFWMLSGRPYWRAAHAAQFVFEALLAEKLFEPIEPASTRAASLGVGGTIPAAFDDWFACCVDREPTHRFASARAAFDALVHALGGVAAPPERATVPLLPPAASSTLRSDAPTPLPAGAMPPPYVSNAPATTPMAGAFSPALRSSPPVSTTLGRKKPLPSTWWIAGGAVLAAGAILIGSSWYRSRARSAHASSATSRTVNGVSLAGSNVHAVGETWRLGNFEYRVERVDSRAEIAGGREAPARPAAGSSFVVVHFTETNRGTSTYTAMLNPVQLLDARGHTLPVSPSGSSALAFTDPAFSLLVTLEPNVPRPSVIVFEVANDAISPTVDLVFEERGLTSTGRATVRAAVEPASAIAAPPVSPQPNAGIAPSAPSTAGGDPNAVPSAMNPGTSTVTSAPTPAVPHAVAPASGASSHRVGETFALGGFTYRFQRVRRERVYGTGSSRETAEQGQVFVFVEFTETNDGATTAMGLNDNVVLHDWQDRPYRMSGRLHGAIAFATGHPEEIITVTLRPHAPRDSVAAFEVPDEVLRHTFTLRVEQRGLMSDAFAQVRVEPADVR